MIRTIGFTSLALALMASDLVVPDTNPAGIILSALSGVGVDLGASACDGAATCA